MSQLFNLKIFSRKIVGFHFHLLFFNKWNLNTDMRNTCFSSPYIAFAFVVCLRHTIVNYTFSLQSLFWQNYSQKSTKKKSLTIRYNWMWFKSITDKPCHVQNKSKVIIKGKARESRRGKIVYAETDVFGPGLGGVCEKFSQAEGFN